MNPDLLSDFLLTCLLLNYLILLWWFTLFSLAHDRLYHLHSRWFQLTPSQFGALHYAGMALYKVGVLLLNLVPWLALQILT